MERSTGPSTKRRSRATSRPDDRRADVDALVLSNCGRARRARSNYQVRRAPEWALPRQYEPHGSSQWTLPRKIGHLEYQPRPDGQLSGLPERALLGLVERVVVYLQGPLVDEAHSPIHSHDGDFEPLDSRKDLLAPYHQ